MTTPEQDSPAAIELADKKAAELSKVYDQSPEASKFALLQRQANALSKSDIIPKSFQGNASNCLIALNFAERLGAEPLAVMQSLHVIHGKPGWTSTFLIANINSSKQFTRLRWDFKDLGEKTATYDGKPIKFRNLQCTAWTTDAATGERIEAEVTVEMAVLEGWYSKPGSKWPTMTKQMLQYRSASFFARLYAPHIALGLSTRDELEDMAPVRVQVEQVKSDLPTPSTSPFQRKEPKWEEPGQRSFADVPQESP